MTTLRVRVPASIANLGSGFDVLAFAVDLWLEVEVGAEPADAPGWTFTGEGAATLGASANPLSRLPLRGTVRNFVPMGVGLGSSAAARVAAAALLGLDRDAAFARASEEEGHPDNAAAATYGGVRLSSAGHLLSLPAPDAEIALLVANEPAPTDHARAALPPSVPLGDAVFNAGRVGLLVDALHTGRLHLLREAMEDRLHQPPRRHLYPWTAAAIEAALREGAYGAAISGAGPSVFAVTPPNLGAAVAQAMAGAAPGRGRPLVSRVARRGLEIVRDARPEVRGEGGVSG
ncbi:MAG: homoserine kinase [Candidatus Dormibacteraceae bacterium]